MRVREKGEKEREKDEEEEEEGERVCDDSSSISLFRV